MKLSKVFVSLLILTLLVQSVQSFGKKGAHHAAKKVKKIQEDAQNTCPNFKLVSCAEKVKKTIMQCTSESDAMECVYQLLEGTSCYPCIDKVLPSFSNIETERQKESNKNAKHSIEIEKEAQKINDVIHQYATCGSKELFECKAKVKRIVNKCKSQNNSQECISQKLQGDSCSVCLCKISPESCTEQQNNNFKQSTQQQQKNEDDSLGFLGSLRDKLSQVSGNIRKQQEEQKQKEKEKKSQKNQGFDLESMAGSLDMLGQLGSMTQKNTLNDLAGLAKMMETTGQKKTGSMQDNLQMGMMMGVMQQFMNDPAKAQSLLDQLQIDETELEGDNLNYDDLQQKITQKVMSNPKILEQFLGNKYDMGQMQQLLVEDSDNTKTEDIDDTEDYSEEDYSEDYDEEQDDSVIYEDYEFDDKCQNPKQQDQCKWKILKILPSCIGADTKICVSKLLKNHACNSCICQVIPQAC